MFSPPSLYAEAGQHLGPLDALWRVAMGGKMQENQMLKFPEGPTHDFRDPLSWKRKIYIHIYIPTDTPGLREAGWTPQE